MLGLLSWSMVVGAGKLAQRSRGKSPASDQALTGEAMILPTSLRRLLSHRLLPGAPLTTAGHLLRPAGDWGPTSPSAPFGPTLLISVNSYLGSLTTQYHLTVLSPRDFLASNPHYGIDRKIRSFVIFFYPALCLLSSQRNFHL